MTDPLDAFKDLIERDATRRERHRPCCKNCAWFSGGDPGQCWRNPPVRVKGRWARPKVGKDDVCGEFTNSRTGETVRGEHATHNALRARVAELEERVDRMRESQE